jgi:hypothetical protein
MATKQLTIDDLISKFSPEEIQNALAAKQQRELQPRKDKAIETWNALKAEVAAIREIDPAFPLPWKSGGRKAGGSGGGKKPTDTDLLTIQTFLAGGAKQLSEVAKHIGVHHLALKSFLRVYPQFKLSKQGTKAFLSYSPK